LEEPKHMFVTGEPDLQCMEDSSVAELEQHQNVCQEPEPLQKDAAPQQSKIDGFFYFIYRVMFSTAHCCQ
jgi:hypothetical protein